MKYQVPCYAGGITALRNLLLAILTISSAYAAAAPAQPYLPQPLSPDVTAYEIAVRSPHNSEVHGEAMRGQTQGRWRAPYRPQDGLSMAEAELVVLVYNPHLRASRARACVPVLSAPHAGLPDDPEIDIDILRVLKSGFIPWELAGILQFTLPVSGRLDALKSQADARAFHAMAQAYRDEHLKLREFRNLWIDWTVALENTKVARASLSRLDDVVSSTVALEAAQELTRTEARPFEMARLQLQLELSKHEAEARQLRQQIVATMGLSEKTRLNLHPGFTLPDVHYLGTTSATLATYSPGILVQATAYDVADREYYLETRKQYSDLRIGPALEEKEGAPRAGGSFGFTLPLWNRNRFEVTNTAALRDAARYDWEEAYQQAMADLASAKTRKQAAEERLEMISDQLLPMADTQTSEVRALAGLGAFDPILLRESLAAQLEIQLERVQAEADIARARADVMLVLPARAARRNSLGTDR